MHKCKHTRTHTHTHTHIYMHAYIQIPAARLLRQENPFSTGAFCQPPHDSLRTPDASQFEFLPARVQHAKHFWVCMRISVHAQSTHGHFFNDSAKLDCDCACMYMYIYRFYHALTWLAMFSVCDIYIWQVVPSHLVREVALSSTYKYIHTYKQTYMYIYIHA